MNAKELGRLIRVCKPAILARWEREVRGQSLARNLPRPALVDSMPDLVDRLAQAADLGFDAVTLGATASEHAEQRLELGYDIAQLIAEYAALRIAIIDEMAESAADIPLSEWRPLSCVIEAAVCEAAARFSRARERKLRALERISTETLRGDSVDELLRTVIDVLAEAVTDVDEVTILLQDDGELHVRASRGLQKEVGAARTIRAPGAVSGSASTSQRPS